MKDSCSSVSKLLEKYFDHEVTEKERYLVEGHLLDCETCQDALRLMGRLREAIKNPIEEATEEESFPWVWEKIERRIQLQEKPTWREFLRSWVDISPLFQKKVWVPSVAAMAILLLVIVPLLLKKTPSYSSPSVVEYVESQTYNVMVYESEKGKVTVIWLFEGPEKGSPPS
jgi:anti-sigma-K factor RskA